MQFQRRLTRQKEKPQPRVKNHRVLDGVVSDPVIHGNGDPLLFRNDRDPRGIRCSLRKVIIVHFSAKSALAEHDRKLLAEIAINEKDDLHRDYAA